MHNIKPLPIYFDDLLDKKILGSKFSIEYDNEILDSRQIDVRHFKGYAVESIKSNPVDGSLLVKVVIPSRPLKVFYLPDDLKLDPNDRENRPRILRVIIDELIATYYPFFDSIANVIDDLTESNIYDQIEQFFTHGLIGMCGCGCPEETKQKIVDFLEIVASDKRYAEKHPMFNEKFGTRNITDDPMLQFMAYILDEVELIEHGTSINCPWITDLGRACLYIYQLYFTGEFDTEEE